MIGSLIAGLSPLTASVSFGDGQTRFTMREARKLTRDEMIALVKRIIAADGTEEEIDTLVELFDANCLHPKKDELIFWPHGFPHDPTKPEPTVEEIVDAAMTPVPGSIIRL